MDKFYVGQKVVLERSFSLEEVIAYANLSGDDNPLHINEEFAKNSRFGKNIVQYGGSLIFVRAGFSCPAL